MDSTAQNPSLLVVLLSGAMGAIIGSLIPLAIQPYLDHRAKLYKQKVAHRNRLNKLELNLLDIDSGLHDNVIAATHLMSAIEGSKMTNQRLMPVKIDDRAFVEILSSQVNEGLHYIRYDLIRLERDTHSFNKLYDILNQSFLNNSVTHDFYAMQVSGLAKELPTLIRHMQRIQKDTTRLLAIARARQHRDRTWLMKHRAKIQQKWIKNVREDEIKLWQGYHERTIQENQKKYLESHEQNT